jgi:hypothetical protein
MRQRDVGTSWSAGRRGSDAPRDPHERCRTAAIFNTLLQLLCFDALLLQARFFLLHRP